MGSSRRIAPWRSMQASIAWVPFIAVRFLWPLGSIVLRCHPFGFIGLHRHIINIHEVPLGLCIGSNIDDLYDSVYNKLLKLPDDTHIYPGHDYGNIPSISLRENKKISDLLQAKDKEDFKSKMIRYEKNRQLGL